MPKKLKNKNIKNNGDNKRTSGFRIFGDELGRDESVVDVKVSGTDRDGNIYLEETDANAEPEEWVIDSDTLGDLYEEELIVSTDDIPVENHQMWGTLEQIGKTRSNIDMNNFVDQNLRDSARSLFRALIETGKDT